MPANELDALAVEPLEVAGVVPLVRHVVALGERGLDVDLAGDGLCRAGHPASRGQHVAGADQRFGWDASVIGALPAGQPLLHDGRSHPTVHAASGRVLARGVPVQHGVAIIEEMGADQEGLGASPLLRGTAVEPQSALERPDADLLR